MNHTLDLGPGQKRFIDAEGDFFAVVQSAVDLEIGLVGREASLYSQGDTYTTAPGEKFRSIGVRNPSPATVRVIIFAGFGRYSQQRQSVLEPKTRVIGASGSLAGLDSIDLDPALFMINGDIRRKCILVSNPDLSLKLELHDEDGNAFLVIEPETSITVPISERCLLVNPNGAAVQYKLGQVFWKV